MEKTWKILDLLNTTTDYLKQKSIENARLNAELLLADVLNIERLHLYVEFERPVAEKELSAYRSRISRRVRREPLQYILGRTEFMGLPFYVDSSVLIPRPETEILCEEVLKLQNKNGQISTLLDIGTGSGCIAVSLAHLWPGLQVTAIDYSTEALETAKKNALLNKVDNITFLQQNIFQTGQGSQLEKAFSIIVSNPPYISKDEMKGLQKEVADFEPRIALTDEADGMQFYTHILKMLSSQSLKCDYCFLEMSGSFPEKIVKTAELSGFSDLNVIKDLNGIDRVLKIKTSH
ncbi:MAG: peptide chain release factor N(5)-glutamine methyltransferase [Calditrichae bacterium]|nr:peptide chain release factor N(5)-glutamine methyltransferase [Calditrichota bacterium]MCB9059380.1 peptide chain release factor N(5)-glutamine methyltransferase [Calditrichia bacterium]